MADNFENNPFVALFPNLSDAQSFSHAHSHTGNDKGLSIAAATSAVKAPEPVAISESPPGGTTTEDALQQEVIEKLKISQLIEDIFLITLDKEGSTSVDQDRPARCVYLEDLHESLKGQDWIDVDCLDNTVFERLMLEDVRSKIITTWGKGPNPQAANDAGEVEQLRYLYHCYRRAHQRLNKTKGSDKACVERCLSTAVLQSKTLMQHPEVFGDLKPCRQFLDIFLDEYSCPDAQVMCKFFEAVAVEIDNNKEEGTVFEVFQPVLDEVKVKFQKEASLGHGTVYVYADLVLFFTSNACLAQALMQHTTPRNTSSGHTYEDTLLGAMLSISCIPKNDGGPYEFFDRPSRYSKQEHDIAESNIHQPLSMLNDKVYQIIYNLLKVTPNLKNQMLNWLGDCLHVNKGRAKIWSHQVPAIFNQLYASDGFFLNLCAVLLRLCQPFSEPQSSKLLRIQPTYCIATEGSKQQREARNVHMLGLHEETCLMPLPEEKEHLKLEAEYNFVTECFFMSHHCLHLGFHVIHEKFVKLNQELHRVQNLYQEIVSQGGENSEPGQKIKTQMEKGMSLFLSLKAAMVEPKLLENAVNLHVATATYLSHVATQNDTSQFVPIVSPIPDTSPVVLTCIPEFLAENIMDFMLFVRRFKDSIYEMIGDRLEHLMTFVLVFLGSPDRMRNPHLRARMAEALEALMPPKDQGQSSLIITPFQREQLFHKHPLLDQFAEKLLHVFVSIEMTGQGVEFEQKFNYRRPMYAILEHIWKIGQHRDAIQMLAVTAEANIEATDPPLFLRFINLLINDAIFLLDEALSYMSQIKEKQEERDRGDWANLQQQQRQEQEMGLRQLGMLARFHNIMGNDTIRSLEMITREIKTIFTDEVMVDRIAAMLNYFLLHLVGPKKKNLKVKDFDEYDFKPQEFVSHICQIYLNLGDDDNFCLAVTRDGRSYSHDLFVQAEKVLYKISQPRDKIMQFSELAASIQAMASRQQAEEEALMDAPEEFLDPILGTLMKDPVMLPTSGQTVDRSTIARHILSDQSDPFNREPLTMDMVKPAVELKAKIEQWISDIKKS